MSLLQSIVCSVSRQATKNFVLLKDFIFSYLFCPFFYFKYFDYPNRDYSWILIAASLSELISNLLNNCMTPLSLGWGGKRGVSGARSQIASSFHAFIQITNTRQLATTWWSHPIQPGQWGTKQGKYHGNPKQVTGLIGSRQTIRNLQQVP